MSVEWKRHDVMRSAYRLARAIVPDNQGQRREKLDDILGIRVKRADARNKKLLD